MTYLEGSSDQDSGLSLDYQDFQFNRLRVEDRWNERAEGCIRAGIAPMPGDRRGRRRDDHVGPGGNGKVVSQLLEGLRRDHPYWHRKRLFTRPRVGREEP